MLKLIFTGLWVAAVTLGSVYFSIQNSTTDEPEMDEARKKAVQQMVKGEMLTFPVIAQGRVEGYFLSRTSYIFDKTKLVDIKLPIPVLLTDELYTELVGDKVIRIEDTRNFDLKGFKERVKQAINKRLGSETVLEVIVEQIDYITKEELMASIANPGASVKRGDAVIREKAPTDIPLVDSEGNKPRY